MDMKESLQVLQSQALTELKAVKTPAELKELRVKYLGRKGPMTEILRGMGKVPAAERPVIGQVVYGTRSCFGAGGAGC